MIHTEVFTVNVDHDSESVISIRTFDDRKIMEFLLYVDGKDVLSVFLHSHELQRIRDAMLRAVQHIEKLTP